MNRDSEFPAASRPTVGFVGLGLMGGPMSAVMSRKFPTVGPGLVRPPVEDAGGEGVRILADPATAAEAADIICLSLPTSQASIDVTRAIAQAAHKRVKLIVELSTVGIGARTELRYCRASRPRVCGCASEWWVGQGEYG